MATFSKLTPSGSTNGRGIKIVAVATPGTLFHTAITGIVSFDEVWLYLFNSDTVSHVVTVEFGGVTAPDDNVVLTVQPRAGLVCAIPGICLNNAVVVRAFADLTNVITMSGFVNRIVL